MPCYRPITAYRAPGQAITFREGPDTGAELKLPCGRCIGCRQKRTLAWATRCMHEAQMHRANSFITLTFDDHHYKPGLDYHDFQAFMKRLRKTKGPTRFFAAGEYGTLQNRPHWHALLFGCAFANQQRIGERIYRSPELEQLWPYGFSSIGEVTHESAAYVASYCIKKATGPAAHLRYSRVNLGTGEIISVNPETAHMSLKPGIGYAWFKKYWREIAEARDGIVLPGGKKIPTPRYYDKLLSTESPTLSIQHETQRMLDSNLRWKDNTQDRLRVKEQVALANQQRKRRTL